VCGGFAVPCGRPLLVDGSPRTSRPTAREDWIANVDLELDASSLAAIAWREDAIQEHASVAAFAQLALELLALGAPPDLVAEANRAAIEEIEHARTCFAIAGHLGVRATGPASLSLEGMTFKDLASLAIETAKQSCVGETVAGLALSLASEKCDPSLAPLLAKMADEEIGHAALGWKIVAWACTRDATVRERVKQALVVGEYRSQEGASEEWNRAGRLTSSDMLEVTARARAIVGDAAALV
jgi:hypothetical protein